MKQKPNKKTGMEKPKVKPSPWTLAGLHLCNSVKLMV